MKAETLREAAALVREDCPIPAQSRRFDFIDYPTGFALQRGGVEHVEKCSATQTNGAMLCDCEGIYPTWRRWKALLAVADWLDQTARLHESGSSGPLDMPPALTVARAYLGESA